MELQHYKFASQNVWLPTECGYIHCCYNYPM